MEQLLSKSRHWLKCSETVENHRHEVDERQEASLVVDPTRAQ